MNRREFPSREDWTPEAFEEMLNRLWHTPPQPTVIICNRQAQPVINALLRHDTRELKREVDKLQRGIK